eukprot:Phypoly_transcript_08596.p1 GENE.Phypoly_transcript_08596~~Phypoly_transcript_08596.p1  ORF type:complete len:393 (+),score=79.78 Phypoly_transcript_08596:104-1282(+)
MTSWFHKLAIRGNTPPTQPTGETEHPPPPIIQEGADDVSKQTPQGQGHSIRQGLSGIGGFFANVATKIITTLEEEKEHFLHEREGPDPLIGHRIPHSNQDNDTIILPLWLAIHHDDPKTVEEARNAILGLTKSKRNFLNAPPEDVNFTIDYQNLMAQALVAVNADPKLNMARFYLVPTYIKEEEFWRNWIYRVHIILTAFGLSMPEPKKNTTPSPPTAELASSPSSPKLTIEDTLRIEKELGELGIHPSESTPEAWEEELKRELSTLDPSKETSDSILSQNWEEELMLELGLKNSSKLQKGSTDKTPSPTTLHQTTDPPATTTTNQQPIETLPISKPILYDPVPYNNTNTASSTSADTTSYDFSTSTDPPSDPPSVNTPINTPYADPPYQNF